MRQFEDSNETPTSTKANHDCAYQEHHLRCRFPGAISDGTTGQGPFYCRIHARERGTQLAHQCLAQSQTWIPRPVQENLAWLNEHLPHEVDETTAEYNLRRRDFVLANLKTFSLKPVVSNSVAKPDVRSSELVEF
jgi:hypothetical protein